MIQSLRTFVIVAETRSMSVAARNLLYSQSSVAYHVRVLEKELGVRLLIRTDGRLEVTAIGREVLALGTELLQTADRMMAATSHFKTSQVSQSRCAGAAARSSGRTGAHAGGAGARTGAGVAGWSQPRGAPGRPVAVQPLPGTGDATRGGLRPRREAPPTGGP